MVVEAPARGQRDGFLRDSRDGTASISCDGNSMKGNTKIFACHLQPLMLFTAKPRQCCVAGKEISPSFKSRRNFDAYLLGSLHDRRAGIGREDVRPEFGSRETPANIHHEVDRFPALLGSFT